MLARLLRFFTQYTFLFLQDLQRTHYKVSLSQLPGRNSFVLDLAICTGLVVMRLLNTLVAIQPELRLTLFDTRFCTAY